MQQWNGYKERKMQAKKPIECLADLPLVPFTNGSMTWNKTGDWRYLTPTVKNRLSPCVDNCPLHNPVPLVINALRQGNPEEALNRLLAANPFPGLTGCLCYHPCQTRCFRKKIDGSVAIQKIEKALAEHPHIPSLNKQPPTLGRAAVYGAGPIGLACAYALGLAGWSAAVFDPRSRPGGPLLELDAEILDPEVLTVEIERMQDLSGAEFKLGQEVDPSLFSGFDLLILDPAAGLDIPDSSFQAWKEETLKTVIPELSAKLIPFKPPRIAHYIALGLKTAQHILAGSAETPQGEELSTIFGNRDLPPLNPEDISFNKLSVDSEESSTGTETGASFETILVEAHRCLSCGVCTFCLECVTFCPDASITQQRPGELPAVDLDHCKGCGICAYECPRGVISMEETAS